jgi:copper chaperone CopZ
MSTTTTLSIHGMSCSHCVRAVDGALKALDGVKVESVEIGSATIAYEPDAMPLERITSAIEEEGFAVTGSSARG